jgi:hypothetical protein
MPQHSGMAAHYWSGQMDSSDGEPNAYPTTPRVN